MKKIRKVLSSLSNTSKWILIGATSIIIIITLLLIVFGGNGNIEISVESALKELVATSQLRTAEYTYNSIAVVKGDDNVKYYISYEGQVTAGFDFENLQVERDGNVIRIIIPDIEIQSVIVDPKMDYIFTKEEYNTETAYAEALQICKDDLLNKAKTNVSLFNIARDSAKDTIMALLKPFESRLDKGEAFEIIFVSDAKEVA